MFSYNMSIFIINSFIVIGIPFIIFNCCKFINIKRFFFYNLIFFEQKKFFSRFIKTKKIIINKHIGKKIINIKTDTNISIILFVILNKINLIN